ncbi:NnrU family protein [uncultured Roseobacter sp.]|uniref:NnrU family protein n=1 Tax=uncultured Roseobacter sp. TaxID=114847 RepID=UPI00260A2DAC|nr:NnrU family protein [uncultured Roseobacter sp.]
MSWAGFIGIFVLFFATHSIPVRPAIKSRIVGRIGPRRFAMGYSVLSLVMLALLIQAARMAPYIGLWPQSDWQRHVAQSGMLIVCLILAFAIGRPNPFSFGGVHNETFEPARAGIIRLLRHPMLAALALWAFLHMLPNGDLAHVLMFGVLGSFALGGRRLINHRRKTEMGPAEWERLNAAVARVSVPMRPVSWPGAAVRLAFGIALFAVLIVLHPVVIGVPAL